MRKSLYALAIAALALGWSTSAHAQAEHYTNKPIELNIHGGAMIFDDLISDDTELGFGGRLAYNMPNGVGIGGNLDWSQVTVSREEGGEVDINIYLYSAEVDYTFAASTKLHPFVGAGVGAATFSPDINDAESETELMVPIAAGIKWFNETNSPTWAIRAEVRDNIVFATAEDENGGGVFENDETLNNIEISAGVSFFFGGVM